MTTSIVNNRMSILIHSFLHLLILANILCIKDVWGLEITSPPNGATLSAGPDFATDELGDPWDMSNPEDISINPDDRNGWENIKFTSEGKIGGKIIDTDAFLTFLSPGHEGIINPGRNGINSPINPKAYSLFSIKLHTTIGGDLPSVYWFKKSPAPTNEYQKFIFNLFTPPSTIAGSQILYRDLTDEGNKWSIPETSVYGLRFDPNGIHSNFSAHIDWVRLTKGDFDEGASKLTVDWNNNRQSEISLYDNENTKTVISKNATRPFNWNYGILPPGKYRIRLNQGEDSAESSFTITSPPIIKVTSPSVADGEEFASTILGNPWDMNDPADVARLENCFDNRYEKGYLTAVNSNNDPAIIAHDSNTIEIDSTRYRYLNYRLKIDGKYDLGAGSMTRIIWSSDNFPDASRTTTSRDIIAFPGTEPDKPGFVDYFIDLKSLTKENGGLEVAGRGENWASDHIKYFRIDPHEFSSERRFYLDDLTLRAQPESTGQFDIRYSVVDEDTLDSAGKVRLYYTTEPDKAPQNVITDNLPFSIDGVYTWNTASIPEGEYFVCAEANDGKNTRNNCADAPLIIRPKEYHFTIEAQPKGTGKITISTDRSECSEKCSVTVGANTGITLTAIPYSGYKFSGWSGACASIKEVCSPPTNTSGHIIGHFDSIPNPTLEVSKIGGGAVTSLTNKINCGDQCYNIYLHGEIEILTPIPNTGYQFDGWNGACSGSANCNLIMNTSLTVGASFSKTPQYHSLDISVINSGSVMSDPAGILCPTQCSATYLSGTDITLYPTAAAGYYFTGWSGACSGLIVCTVSMSGNQSVTAHFASVPPGSQLLSVNKYGQGAVTSLPSGINCGIGCSYPYPSNTVVTLFALAEPGYTFTGWGGGCSGKGSCMVTLSSVQSVTAAFKSNYLMILPIINDYLNR